MAEAFIAAVSAVGSSVGGATGAAMILGAVEIGTTLYYVTAVAASMAYGSSRRRAAARAARDSFNAQLEDRLVMLSLADGPRSRCYGTVRNVDGILFKGTHGANSENYVLVVAICGHEIDGFIQHFADDLALTLDVDGYCTNAPYARTELQDKVLTNSATAGVTVNRTLTHPLAPGTNVYVTMGSPNLNDTGLEDEIQVTGVSVVGTTVSFTPPVSGRYAIRWQTEVQLSSFLRIRPYVGTPGENLAPILEPLFPSLVDASDRFDTGAKLLVEMKYDPDAYPSGVPTFSSVFRGARVLDRRTGTTAFSRNPACIADDWARYPYGGALTSADLIIPDVIAAANASDVSTTFDYGVHSTTRPLYQANLVIRLDGQTSPDRVMDSIVEAMAGRWSYSGGQLTMRAGAYRAPAITIDEDWISNQGGVQIVPEPTIDEAVNVWRCRLADEAQNYTPSPGPEYRVAEWVTADGRDLAEDVTFSAITDTDHATHVLSVMAREKRNGLTVQIPLNMRGLQLKLFTVVELNLPRYGFVNKIAEILDWQCSPTGGFNVVAKEVAAALYTPNVLFPRLDATPNTAFPDPFALPTPAAPTLLSDGTTMLKQEDGTIVPRMIVSWPAITDAKVAAGGVIQVRYGRNLDPSEQWRVLTLPGDATTVVLSDLKDGAFYGVQLRTGSRLVLSQRWSLLSFARAVGKSALPAAPTGFTATPMLGLVALAWSAPTEVDIAGSIVRQGASFGVGVQVFRGAATSYNHPQADAVSQTFWLAHYDTSGNVGPAISVTASSLQNIAAQNYDFLNDASGWTGISSIGSATDASGGKYGEHVGTVDLPAYPRFQAVDPLRLYRVTVRVRATGGAGGPISAGVIGRDQAGNVITNSGGTPHAFAAALSANLPGDTQWRLFSALVTGVQAIPTAALDTSKFLQGTVFAAPTVMPVTGFAGQLQIDYVTLDDITSAAVLEGNRFEPYLVWDFGAAAADGWSAVNAALTFNASSIIVTATADNPQLISPPLNFAGNRFDRIRALVRRVSGSNWEGACYWVNAAHGYTTAFRALVPAQQQPGQNWTLLEWDMSKLADGGTDWLDGQVSRFRLDLAALNGNAFEIDWIALGRMGVFVDLSAVSPVSWVSRGATVRGNAAVKTSGANGVWDVDVYSKESYVGGAYAAASFAGGSCMFGLNSDPLTDSNWNSLDFALYYSALADTVQVRQNGTAGAPGDPVIASAITPDDVFAVVYDGSRVRYLRNGLDITPAGAGVAGPNLRLFWDSSFFSSNAQLKDMRFGPLTSNYWGDIGGDGKPSDFASADLVLIDDGNCVQQGNRITKTAGGQAWNAGMHSRDAYPGGAFASFVVAPSFVGQQLGAFGLNDSPGSASYTDLNFAIILSTSNNVDLYAEGVLLVNNVTTWGANDLFAIAYDGFTARYIKNGQVVHSQQITNLNPFYLDCSLYRQGGFFDRVRFGPLSAVAGILTNQIGADAISSEVTLTNAAGITYSNTA